MRQIAHRLLPISQSTHPTTQLPNYPMCCIISSFRHFSKGFCVMKVSAIAASLVVTLVALSGASAFAQGAAQPPAQTPAKPAAPAPQAPAPTPTPAPAPAQPPAPFPAGAKFAY